MNQLKQETQKLNKLREGIQRKLRDAENHKLEVEQQRETLRSQVQAMERGLTSETYTSFFTVRHGMQTRYSDGNSVRPSVTRVNCDKTVERSVQICIPYERSFILVF